MSATHIQASVGCYAPDIEPPISLVGGECGRQIFVDGRCFSIRFQKQEIPRE